MEIVRRADRAFGVDARHGDFTLSLSEDGSATICVGSVGSGFRDIAISPLSVAALGEWLVAVNHRGRSKSS